MHQLALSCDGESQVGWVQALYNYLLIKVLKKSESMDYVKFYSMTGSSSSVEKFAQWSLDETLMTHAVPAATVCCRLGSSGLGLSISTECS